MSGSGEAIKQVPFRTAIAAWALLWLGFRLAGLTVIHTTNGGVPVGASVPSKPQVLPPGAERPESIIIFVADGLGFTHLSAARVVHHGPRGAAAWDRFEAHGWHQSHPAEGLIIDSAAAATALATGRETRSGAVSVDAAGNPLETLFEAASRRGYRTGLVTDSFIWDATPAAFVAHATGRGHAASILEQIAASDLEVLFGELVGVGEGETPQWDATLELLRKRFVLLDDALDGPPGSEPPTPVAGIFPEDAIGSLDSTPTLPQMVTAALNRLSSDDRPFALMVESEEPDTASHENDFDRLLRGMKAVEAALDVVLDYAESDPGTLVLFTSDHETGGLALISDSTNMNLKALWATRYHTASVVPVMALGPGAEYLAGTHTTAQVGQILASLLRPAGPDAVTWHPLPEE